MNGRELAALAGQDNMVVIRRPFVDWLGHVPDAILVDQLMFWQLAAGEGEWWSKTEDEMADDLCLGVKALAQARGRLIAREYLQVRRQGMPARMEHLVDLDKIAADFLAFLGGVGVTSGAKGRRFGRQRAPHSIQGSKEGKTSPKGRGATQRDQPTQPAAARRRSPWADFTQQILDDYHVAATKSNCSAAGVAVANAQANGLGPEEASREWAAWMATVKADGDRWPKMLPIHKAGNAWAAEWLGDEAKAGGAGVVQIPGLIL